MSVKYMRILDRFKIIGRGTVYEVETDPAADIRIGDIFKDLRRNRFAICGIEMFRRTPYDGRSVGLLFRMMDGVEAKGDILIRENEHINFLFCSHPLYPRRIDEDYEQEYREASIDHPCALFSYEDLEMGRLKMYGETIFGPTVYRGWMMKPELYRRFYQLLAEKDIILINTPEEYERYHILPGWYADFENDTASTVWETGGFVENALKKAEGLEGPYIVKDYVKSRKHEWYDACYIPNIANTSYASKIISSFADRQGEDLIGGIVLRKYEKLKQIGFHPESGMPIAEEYRVFILAGHVHTIDDYWREGEKVNLSDSEMKWIESLAQRVKSNFVSMDIGRREDGSLMIMEFGDGQVSGLQQIDTKAFYTGFDI